MSLVRMTVSGRAATDPTVRDVNGSACTSFTIAADTGTKDESGNWESIFISVSVWGKRGESIAKHLKKGERVLVMGNFSQRLYKDKSNETRVQNRISAQDVDYLGGGAKAAQPTQAAPGETPAPSEDDVLPF